MKNRKFARVGLAGLKRPALAFLLSAINYQLSTSLDILHSALCTLHLSFSRVLTPLKIPTNPSVRGVGFISVLRVL
jgi:hypothetical protein